MTNRWKILKIASIITLSLMTTSFAADKSAQGGKFLLFTKTADFRHKSIEVGVVAMKAMAEEKGFTIVHTEDTDLFAGDKLKEFDALIFMNSSGNVFNEAEEAALMDYIHSGGGFVGIHLAGGTEMKKTIWPWFMGLVGGRFTHHPKRQDATMVIEDREDSSTRHLQPRWRTFGEWYNFEHISPDIHVLISLDETTYDLGGKPGMGDFHPLAWHHEYEGGRSFYTGLGHTKESYSDPDFLEHVYGGILYAMRRP